MPDSTNPQPRRIYKPRVPGRKWLKKAISWRSERPRLCEKCQRIDFWNPDSAPAQEFHTTFEYRKYEESTLPCSLCTLILHRLPNFRMPGCEEYDPIPITLKFRGNQAYVWNGSRNIGKIRPLGEHETGIKLYDDSNIDVGLIKRWLERCDTEHNEKQEIRNPIPLTLIDVQRHCLVRRSSNERYFALSYVWGGVKQFETKISNFEELQTESSLLNHQLSKVLRDVIALMRSIGEQYLWVDSLCIIQDSHEKHHDIHQMDKVYSHSYLTIIAVDGKNADSSLPGIQPFSRLPIYKSAKFNGRTFVSEPPDYVDTHLLDSNFETRAWTLQERMLSSRILYITSQQVLFQCQTDFCAESKASRHGEFKRTKSGIPVSWQMLQVPMEGIYDDRWEDMSGMIRPGTRGGVLVGKRVSDLARIVDSGDVDTAALLREIPGAGRRGSRGPLHQHTPHDSLISQSSADPRVSASKALDLDIGRHSISTDLTSELSPSTDSLSMDFSLSIGPTSLRSLLEAGEGEIDGCYNVAAMTKGHHNPIDLDPSPGLKLRGPSLTWAELLPLYQDLVEMYTARHLTYDYDILRAFLGLSSMLSKVCASRFLYGMPSAVLASSLLWGPKHGCERRLDRYGNAVYPSWCWAGWAGAVTYPSVVRGMTKDFSSTVRFRLPCSMEIWVHEPERSNWAEAQRCAVLSFRSIGMFCTPTVCALGTDDATEASYQTFSVDASGYSCGVFFGCCLPGIFPSEDLQRHAIVSLGVDDGEYDLRASYGLTYPLSREVGGKYRGRTLHVLLVRERGRRFERVACGKMLEPAFDKRDGLRMIELQ
ncbi:HET-domain-containing protein [Eremomyces bilateralis CBS 781.70]|uniref:HET-domain-containing protein n=1 Tax=Eremomyces bilateralis CBS 781.70 TaxID=1392243 RepID=A0A6G1FWK7_9PEZI|nr:HET-domain-containing protein [Eremomyces bilateralis CBS 781.70]KAF1810118.1 HET-domain-containing protein [Eremomyces bilateralis CBS 781.70]